MEVYTYGIAEFYSSICNCVKAWRRIIYVFYLPQGHYLGFYSWYMSFIVFYINLLSKV